MCDGPERFVKEQKPKIDVLLNDLRDGRRVVDNSYHIYFAAAGLPGTKVLEYQVPGTGAAYRSVH